MEEGEPEVGLTHQRTAWWGAPAGSSPKVPPCATQGAVTTGYTNEHG